MNEDELRQRLNKPLLLIFFLRGFEQIGGGTQARKAHYRDGLLLPALGLHFPGDRDPDSPKNLVRYRLNTVAQNELLQDQGDDDDVADGDDDVA